MPTLQIRIRRACGGRLLVRTTSLVLLTVVTVSGCGESKQSEPLTPSARRVSASLETPLRDEEVAEFLAIIRDLPREEAPRFEPPSSAAVDDRLPAATLVETYRREYRRMFDPITQGARWSRDSSLISVLNSRNTSPEDFAALMMRIGCALAAVTVQSQFNLADATEKSEQQLHELTSMIDQWDQRAADGLVPAISATHRRQPLVDQLKDLVALSEFGRTLMRVPEQSRLAILRHQEELAALFPQSSAIERFERTLDAEAVIIPVNHEQFEQSRTSR